MLLAATIQRYHLAWWNFLWLPWARLKRALINNESNRYQVTDEKQDDDKELLDSIQDFFKQCARPFTHAARSMARSWRRVIEEWEDFKLWWRDPVGRSQQPHYRHSQQTLYKMIPLEGASVVQQATMLPSTCSSLSSKSTAKSILIQSYLGDAACAMQPRTRDHFESSQS